MKQSNKENLGEPRQLKFNEKFVKTNLKEMIRKSTSKDMRPESKTNVKPDVTIHNRIELYNSKIGKLENQKEEIGTNVDRLKNYLQTIKEDNSELAKLLDFYKQQFQVKKKKQDDMIMEHKVQCHQEEFQVQEAKQELEKNISTVNQLKEKSLLLEKELTSKEYHLNDLRRRNEEYENKIHYTSLELEEKIKMKMFRQNELANKEQEYNLTKQRILDVGRINEEYLEYLRMLHNDLQERKGNIRVFCRVRKDDAAENASYIEYLNYNTIVLNGPVQKSNVGKTKEFQPREEYKFDRVFRPEDGQEEVFKEISQLVQSALDGYKVCIFAYGQTGSGKTYTMEGGEREETRGIIPRSIEQIFEFKSCLESSGWKFNIEAICYEIYMDQVRDLLSNTIIASNKVDKFTTIEIRSVEEWHEVLSTAKLKRSVAETVCNEKSSRSHCIFQIKINGRNDITKQERNGALNLIDLAGSERISKSKVEDERLKETISINKSLTALKSVITALVNTNVKQTHIPYRDSVLTTNLQNYLGGDSKTLMFVNISPLISNISESSSSLKFASDVNSCYLKSSEGK